MRKAISVDLETTGTSFNCGLVAIGLVVWDQDDSKYVELNSWYDKISFDNLHNPAKFDHSTLWWWMQQSDEARKCFDPQDAKPLYEILTHLGTYTNDCQELWSKGADFDIAILQSKFPLYNMRTPWSYKAARCYRTLEALNPWMLNASFQGEKHNALADAQHQARLIHRAFHGEDIYA